VLNAHHIYCNRHVGGLGLVWCVAFWFLVYEAPHQHPRISYEERTYIHDQMGPDFARELSRSVSMFARRLVADSWTYLKPATVVCYIASLM